MSLTRVLLISKDGQFKFCSISVMYRACIVVTVGYISSCSSLNFFNLVNLGSSMGRVGVNSVFAIQFQFR